MATSISGFRINHPAQPVTDMKPVMAPLGVDGDAGGSSVMGRRSESNLSHPIFGLDTKK